jgi:hypothetical protein
MGNLLGLPGSHVRGVWAGVAVVAGGVVLEGRRAGRGSFEPRPVAMVRLG